MDTSICQNAPTAIMKNIEVSGSQIFRRYFFNPITKAIIFGGLEPMLQFEDILGIVRYFRQQGCNDDFVVYTGYYPEEVQPQINKLKQYQNIVVKFGRYKPDSIHIYDSVLGITLASDNQYGKKLTY